MCFNLGPDEFKKPGHFVVKGKAVMQKKYDVRLRWGVEIARSSREFAEHALSAAERGEGPGSNKVAALQKELEDKGLPQWDTQFQFGNVQESAGTRSGYTPRLDTRIRGRTKEQIAIAMRTLPNTGPLYVQHALLRGDGRMTGGTTEGTP